MSVTMSAGRHPTLAFCHWYLYVQCKCTCACTYTHTFICTHKRTSSRVSPRDKSTSEPGFPCWIGNFIQWLERHIGGHPAGLSHPWVRLKQLFQVMGQNCSRWKVASTTFSTGPSLVGGWQASWWQQFTSPLGWVFSSFLVKPSPVEGERENLFHSPTLPASPGSVQSKRKCRW